MSNSIGETMDLLTRYQTAATTASTASSALSTTQSTRRGKETASNELDFTDMLQLMILQFQSQSIDNTADTSDMMNQLVQMSVMQAMTGMTTKMEELAQANVMSYSASLVGKEVTVGVKDKDGKLQEMVGLVTGTGTYDGQAVIFLGDKSYSLNSIMAVGRLPEKVGETTGKEETPGTGTVTPPASGNDQESSMAAAASTAQAGPDWDGQRTVG